MNHQEPFLDIHIPPDATHDVKQFYEEFKKKFEGKQLNEQRKISMITVVQQYERELREKYHDPSITCRLYGDVSYKTEYWSVHEITENYKKYFKNSYVEKDEYTMIEVNNMLFKLKLYDIIRGYAMPPTIHNEPFHDIVKVEVRITTAFLKQNKEL